jgi:hypothetical protein
MSDADFIPQNFLGLPRETSGYEAARVVVLPIGFEMTTSYGAGTRGGPEAILAASRQVETYDAELDADLRDAPIHTLDALAPDFAAPGAMVERIRHAATRLLADSKWVLGLGGEHVDVLCVAEIHRLRSANVLSEDEMLAFCPANQKRIILQRLKEAYIRRQDFVNAARIRDVMKAV